MQLKLLALGLSVAILSTTCVSAKNAGNTFKPTKLSNLVSKGANDFYSASAVEQNVVTANGNNPRAFLPLSFPSHVHRKGDDIKAEKQGEVFKLEKGSYEITFTGTFLAGSNSTGTPSAFAANLVLSIKIGRDDIPFKVTQSVPLSTTAENFFSIVTYTKVIDLDRDREISIVMADQTAGTAIDSLNRTISIKKL
jgi:hypothetical protein